jgi:2-polyprenyl-3-methyl-5-hydroxy-6-metoxy-1,4-benzoquinol methylase
MNGTNISYRDCPVCSSSHISKVFSCNDWLVTHEKFEVWQCGYCILRFTQHVPGPDSIGKYYQSENYISHSDSEKGLINRVYKVARRFTMASKRKLVIKSTGLRNGRLLDTGCGTGAFLNEMKRTGWQVTGLEPDSGARDKAKELYGVQPLEPRTLFELPEASFDAITLWHVLEHVHDLHGYMDRFRKLLAPNGRLIIAVPNYTSCDAEQYKNTWAAYDVPRHLYHFSPAAMQQLAASHGFALKAIKPMMLDAFYISMLSEQNINGKGNLVKAFLQGLKCTIATMGNVQRSSSLIYILS